MEKLKNGDPAPDFSLPDQRGKIRSLKDFKGKKLVLYTYPKDNTPGCTKEACAFQENLSRLKRKGLEVVGISGDKPESHKKFSDNYGLKFPLLSDVERVTLKKYGAIKKKSMFGKSFLGIKRMTFIIDEKGIIQKIFSDVKVDGHVHEVEKSIVK